MQSIIQRRADANKRDKTELATDVASSTVGTPGRKMRFAVRSKKALATAQDAHDAMMETAALGAQGTELTGDTMGGVGDVFLPGTSSGADPTAQSQRSRLALCIPPR